ncbi:MAG: class I SAM-dependent methyltransferase [Pseudomonadota bacterium]
MTDHGETYVAANLKAWEEAAPIHARHNLARLKAEIARPGFCALDDVATARLKALGVDGADIVQICCNNGIELLSTKAMGAGRCVGIDGAAGFVEQARALADAGGLEAEFITADVHDLPPGLNQSFDIGLITIGVLSWMPDIDRFFGIVSSLLRHGGALLIHEHHPILEMMEPGAAEDPVAWELSYFKETPYVDDSGLDYYGGETYAATPNNSFMHKMSDTIMAGLKAGLAVEHFEELPDHISNSWYNVEASGIGLPMSYVLTFRKT